MYSLEYSTQFKKDFKKITRLTIQDIVEGNKGTQYIMAVGK
jgi:mRNA-degrading endonuclease YafQ of YafQ-DinJ toxin-antitoxin module